MCRGCVFIRIAGLSGVKLPAGGILTCIVCDLQKARFFMRITFRSQYGDYKIIYAFGSESLADTASNIYLAGDRVTNKELQEQFHSLSNRLLEGMPEERWPEFLRRVCNNVRVMIEEDQRIQEENWEKMREWLRKRDYCPDPEPDEGE